MALSLSSAPPNATNLQYGSRLHTQAQAYQATLGPLLSEAGLSTQEIRSRAWECAVDDELSKARKRIRHTLEHVKLISEAVERRLRESPHRQRHLSTITQGHFRLVSTELFDLLRAPVAPRFGTLRFYTEADESGTSPPLSRAELALNESFFVAESADYHLFRLPDYPSIINRGVRARKTHPDGDVSFPEYDSWLLFTFLSRTFIKVEIPIELCADVWGGDLVGCENEEVVFWGYFVPDPPDQ